jgi:hypothetical protein
MNEARRADRPRGPGRRPAAAYIAMASLVHFLTNEVIAAP